MPMDNRELEAERARIAQTALDLVEKRGGAVSKELLLTETGMSRRRMDQLFESEDEIYDAAAGLWFEAHIAVMEEVLASDLPSNRKMYEFFLRRYRITRDRYESDPAAFALICELGTAQFEKVRSFVDLADHYLCEIIAQAQDDGYFTGLEIDEALSLINQMVSTYTLPDALTYLGDRLSEEKLARIIDCIFTGLSGEDRGAKGVNFLKLAPVSELNSGT